MKRLVVLLLFMFISACSLTGCSSAKDEVSSDKSSDYAPGNTAGTDIVDNTSEIPAPGEYNTADESLYTYTVLEDDTCKITDYLGEIQEVMILPETLGGYPVSELQYHLFRHEDTISEVVLPDTIKAIGDKAFEQCYSLEKINIPDNIEKMGLSCFESCEALTSINLGSYITIIDFETFRSSGLTSVTIPNTVKHIYSDAFMYCADLSEAIIPAGVEEIDEDVFEYSDTLTLYVEPGSYAEQYAKANEFNYELI